MIEEKLGKIEIFSAFEPRRWSWMAYDKRSRVMAGPGDDDYGNWRYFSRIEACSDNLAAVMGFEVELIKVGGVYRRAIMIGRNVPIEVIR